MAVVAFDTLKLADKLQAGGFTAEQARTAASAFAEAVSTSDLVAKTDLREMGLRLEDRLAATDARISETKSDILRWMFSAMAAQTALIVGLVKLIH